MGTRIVTRRVLRWASLACGLGLSGPLLTQGARAHQTGSTPTPQLPQASQSSSPYTRPQLGNEPPEPPIPLAGINARKIEHMREDERHKRLVADTTKLLELTNELKTEIDKASKDELSLDVVRKAAEIERLARDVKERMKS